MTASQILASLLSALNEDKAELWRYKVTIIKNNFNTIRIWAVILECAPYADDLATFLMKFLYPENTEHWIKSSNQTNSLTDDALLRFNGFAKAIVTHLVKPMRNIGRPSADAERKSNQATERDKEFKKQLLTRDGARCRLTGIYDPAFMGEVIPVGEEPLVAVLQGAHIIPYSTADKEFFHTLLHIFTSGRIGRGELKGTNINNAANGILLQTDAHGDFDHFKWGLEPNGKGANGEDKYVATRILNQGQTYSGLSFKLPQGWVAFGKAGNNYTGPNPEYLLAHLCIGKMIKELLDKSLVQVSYGYTDSEEDELWEDLDEIIKDL